MIRATPKTFEALAKGGPAGTINRLQLDPGHYPAVTLKGVSGLMIAGSPGAYLQTLNLSGCHGIGLEGVAFQDHVGGGYGANILESSDIKLHECSFDGYEHAFIAGRVDRLELVATPFKNFTSDGIDLVNVWHFLLDNLTITDPNVDLKTLVHPDAIQLRSTPFNPNNYFEKWAPTSDGVISNCRISGVPMQGIALTNHVRDWKAKIAKLAHKWPELPALYGVDDGGMQRVAARHNHVTGGGRALSFSGPTCIDCELTGNTVDTHPDSTQQAVLTYAGATRMVHSGNVMAACPRLRKPGVSD